MAFLLNKSDMASSIGISVQAFDKWGVPPVERRGREVLYDVKTVLEIDRERRQHNQRTPDDGGELEERLLRARAELTEEQAVAQKLKNQVVCELSIVVVIFALICSGGPGSMVRLPPVVMSAKSATARTTIAREDAEDHQVKLSAQKLEELLASMVKDEVDRNDGIY